MPDISFKGKNFPESPIRKLTPYAEKALAEGKKIYHLNIGQPDIKTPKNVIQSIKSIDLNILEYSKSEGVDSLLEKTSNYYKNLGLEVEKNDILITTGASEALLFTFGTITNHGDEIIIPEPFYANYSAFCATAGVKIVPVSTKIENNFKLPNINEFEKLITNKTKAILICNPSNPTGYLYTKQEIEQLVQLAVKHDIFLVSDEAYREFIYDNEKYHSVLNYKNTFDNVIIIDSTSKRYSMCGARIGFLISKNRKVIETALKFAQARLSPPSLAQIATEAALNTPSSYFDKVITEYKDRRDTLISELEKIPEIKIGYPKGAFYCIIELPIDSSENFAKWLLNDYELNNETIMVAPANGFYENRKLGEKQIRIAYVLNKESIIKAITILRKGLKTYQSLHVTKENIS